MKNARVFFSQAHEEDFPEKFVNKLSKEILYEISDQQLTSEILNKYTCIALINPKVSISSQEKEAIKKYKEEDGGIFFTFNILNESQYEKQKMNIDLLAKC
jgi:hypothetical protein